VLKRLEPSSPIYPTHPDPLAAVQKKGKEEDNTQQISHFVYLS